MAPLCGIIIVDYVYAKHGNLHIPSLYTSKPTSLYYFTAGVNWRGVFAWLAAVTLALPGLVAAYRPDLVNQNGKNMVSKGSSRIIHELRYLLRKLSSEMFSDSILLKTA